MELHIISYKTALSVAVSLNYDDMIHLLLDSKSVDPNTVIINFLFYFI